MPVQIRPVTAADRDAWEGLYKGYATFYKIEQTAQAREKVFGWLMDPTHEVNGLVAETDAGSIVGLTHFRPFANPLRGITNCFLDDLFVSPDARGTGAAQALIDGVVTEARTQGWGVVRWITAEDNYRARSVYDKLANRTPWVTYDIKL